MTDVTAHEILALPDSDREEAIRSADSPTLEAALEAAKAAGRAHAAAATAFELGRRAPGTRSTPFEESELRRQLLALMSYWSEACYAASWTGGTEEILYENGGIWEVLGRQIGWPLTYEPNDDQWATWDEAGVIFAERTVRRGW